jgi:hypothetical protein
MFDTSDPMKQDADNVVEAGLEALRRQSISPDWAARLLSTYDEAQRRKRRSAAGRIASAIGWRALARRLAAAGVLAGICAAGFVAGVAARPSDAETYAALDDAVDQSFDLSEEGASWARD